MGSRVYKPGFLLALIHPSAWKGDSPNFRFTAFCELPLETV
jgi:hypothetical protein